MQALDGAQPKHFSGGRRHLDLAADFGKRQPVPGAQPKDALIGRRELLKGQRDAALLVGQHGVVGRLRPAVAQCKRRVMVDGFLMPLGTPMPVASPKQLHGVEVYAGPATIPRELSPNGEDAFCGLVVMWTK